MARYECDVCHMEGRNYPGCHDHCESYIKARAEDKAAKDKLRKEKELDSVINGLKYSSNGKRKFRYNPGRKNK